VLIMPVTGALLLKCVYIWRDCSHITLSEQSNFVLACHPVCWSSLLVMCWRRHSSGIKHFNVERTPTTFYLKDIQFTTLDQLVNYYSHTDVPNKEQIRGVRLRVPITRTTPYRLYDDDFDSRNCSGPDVYIHPVSGMRLLITPPSVSLTCSQWQCGYYIVLNI